MLAPAEIASGLAGAWRLFLGRRDGLRLLDTSFAGFWRSFQVIVLLAPVYALFIASERRLVLDDLPEGAGIDELSFAVWRTLAVLLDWIAFPLVAAALARPLGFARRYVPLIVSYNWGAAIISPLLVLPGALLAGGVIGRQFATLLVLATLALLVRYRFVVARIVLDGRMGLAALVVAVELAVSLSLAEAMRAATGY